MARKKFFYNRVYNIRRTIINSVIIGVSVIGIIVCFILTTKFKGYNPAKTIGLADIKSEVIVEVNQEFGKEIFFSKLESVNLDEISIIYPDDFDISKVGSYTVTIEIGEEKYDSLLTVVDTEKPILALKNITINENDNYNADSFVSSCTDNSNKECVISFYNDAINEDGEKIVYSQYYQTGAYNIKISAKDESGNEIVKDATLIIKKKGSATPVVTPQEQDTCKYGNDKYDATTHVATLFIATDGCAISTELYKDEDLNQKIGKIMDTETIRIKKDVDALNLEGRLALNRNISPLFNYDRTGLLGYELSMSVNLTNNGKVENIVSYKINSDGKRIFSNNPYNLPE